MKKIIIAAIIFAACQCLAIWLISDVNFNQNSEEVDLEIYDFEYNGHQYLIFTEYGRTINVLHDPDCECNHSTERG